MGYFMLVSDPAFIDTQKLLDVGFEGVKFEFEGGSQPVQVREVATPVSISLNMRDKSLDTEGRINSTLHIMGHQNRSIQLSKAFMDYSITS